MMLIIINTMTHISFLLSICMIVIVARKCQHSQIRKALLLLFVFTTIWSIGTLLELYFRLATGVTNRQFINVCYISICLLPIAILYLGRLIMQPDWHAKPICAAFFIIPLASIAVVYTDPLHHLFFVNFSLQSSEAVYGGYFYFHSLYSYGCIAAGIILMFISSVRNFGFFSRQSLLVISGIAITTVPNILYSFGIVALPFSVSSAAFTLTIFCFAVAFLKFRFITALPITLRQVVDLISDGYLVVDKQQGILAFNRSLLHLFQEPVNIPLGTNLRTFVERYLSNISYDRILELQTQAIAKQGTVSTEALLPGDTYVSVEISPVMQRDAHIGTIMLFKNITQSKLFIEATKAESRYKSEFLSNMSHEIRTPMNAIIGMVNIGKSANDIERKDYSLTRIEDASKHLLGVINNILDISKIEAGKFELSPEEFDFEKMLQQVLNVVKFRADEKKQTISVYIDTNIPRIIFGDDQRLAQVITNLVGNAVKFTPKEGTVYIDSRLLGDENGVCTIEVRIIDTGIGISSEHQARLFQSFQQAESNIARNYGGTGLGLAISKNIIEMMGGRIWVESEYGKGATFAFTVQLKRSVDKKNELNANGINWNNIRILAVDDESYTFEYLVEMTHGFGATCELAVNGEEALRFAEQKGGYNFYFIDGKMTVIDGIKLTKALKSRAPAVGGSVVVLIASAEWSEIAEEATAAGVDRYIQKPLFPSMIVDTMSEYLGVDRQQTEDSRQKTISTYSGSRILLVEDIEINREIVMSLLEPTQIKIDCAGNGVEAVRMFRESPEKYDMIFMDVQMPEMDGYEATYTIRALDFPNSKTIPIIAMTANVFREDVEKCIEVGMDGHIGKPLDLEEIHGQLRRYLKEDRRKSPDRRQKKERRHLLERRQKTNRRLLLDRREMTDRRHISGRRHLTDRRQLSERRYMSDRRHGIRRKNAT